MNLSAAIYDLLAADGTLVGLLAAYEGEPAIFTVQPAPGDAILPYIVTAGQVVDGAWDTKTTRGRAVIRDVRCYAAADGSAVVIEAIAERVRALLHRQPLDIDGFTWVISDCNGPITADESGGAGDGVYGRILSLSLTAQED